MKHKTGKSCFSQIVDHSYFCCGGSGLVWCSNKTNKVSLSKLESLTDQATVDEEK